MLETGKLIGAQATAPDRSSTCEFGKIGQMFQLRRTPVPVLQVKDTQMFATPNEFQFIRETCRTRGTIQLAQFGEFADNGQLVGIRRS